MVMCLHMIRYDDLFLSTIPLLKDFLNCDLISLYNIRDLLPDLFKSCRFGTDSNLSVCYG